ncbi:MULTISPECIES: DUF3805 domain-containing protein [Chryseobacterium]|uniref:DUF3805 domain-containing protein n=1 Tax=Chryseobacterium camelliae TaxID=1265445 RepID=A0ABU0TLL0_9FLAO|nr:MULTISPECIES: DUF3805 domain-containing protein [Chryseobacterium]MDT3408463.1 hypothetical protein [Pseudacidovorax intermedius]MDQ1097681.1 hypothetical protein [Chryseobacterium camelliae]MDQ1101610.1 hypothetical protein [Chryseobacterium sp. SORGH_AS_1048]MDR6085053.1 hypothetical protein [Chryseobacterium sp. SORGH_AS_0909]MDR6129408.1 hypothetical protein [Chryseobacterium sp. SORGH_AS_1175]
MNYKKFKSNQGWLSFEYPSSMIQIEEDEGTYLFYTEDTGSFRITPLLLEGKGNFDTDQFLRNRQREYGGEIKLNSAQNEYLYYKSLDEDDDLIIYNWIFAKNDKIIYCSYTIDVDTEEQEKIIIEKREVLTIIENLNFV